MKDDNIQHLLIIHPIADSGLVNYDDVLNNKYADTYDKQTGFVGNPYQDVMKYFK